MFLYVPEKIVPYSRVKVAITKWSALDKHMGYVSFPADVTVQIYS